MPDATFSNLFSPELLLHYDASDAASLFTDTGGTSAASNGNEVKCWKPASDATLAVNLTNANGPTYRSNYASSGYAALEFDGTNDALLNTSTGMTTGQRAFVLAAFTFIGASNTLWCRGNGAAWQRGLCSTTTDALQDSGVGTITSSGIPSARRVTAWVAGANQSQVDSLGFSAGNRSNHTPGTLTAAFTVGALNTGSLSQFGNFALHEIMVIGANCEWGQVIRGAKILRNKWGVTDPNALPQFSNPGGSLINSQQLVRAGWLS